MGTSLWGHPSGVVVTVLQEAIPLWVLCVKRCWLGSMNAELKLDPLALGSRAAVLRGLHIY